MIKQTTPKTTKYNPAATVRAVIITLVVLGAGMLGLAWHLHGSEQTFTSHAVPLTVTVTSTGTKTSRNQQKLTIASSSTSPIGDHTYTRTVDLNDTYSASNAITPYVTGDTIEARALPGQPDSLRLNNSNAYQSGVFMFMGVFFLLVAAAISIFWLRSSRKRT